MIPSDVFQLHDFVYSTGNKIVNFWFSNFFRGIEWHRSGVFFSSLSTYFTPFSSVYIVDIERVNVCRVNFLLWILPATTSLTILRKMEINTLVLAFNIFFNLTYETRGGNSKMKNKSVAKFIHIKESLGLCDIWRVRNTKKKRYTFRQQHVTGFIQKRLDYFLVSNNLQESINKMDILTALSTDHSPIFFSLSKNIDISRGKGLWKFQKQSSKGVL